MAEIIYLPHPLKNPCFQEFLKENMGLVVQATNFLKLRLSLSKQECSQECTIMAWKCWSRWQPDRTEFSTYYNNCWRKYWKNLYRKQARPKEAVLWNQLPINKKTGGQIDIPQGEKEVSNVNGDVIYKHMHLLSDSQKLEVQKRLGKVDPKTAKKVSRAHRHNAFARAKRIFRAVLSESEVFL